MIYCAISILPSFSSYLGTISASPVDSQEFGIDFEELVSYTNLQSFVLTDSRQVQCSLKILRVAESDAEYRYASVWNDIPDSLS